MHIELQTRERNGKTFGWVAPLMTPARLYALICLLVLMFGGRHVW